MAIRLGEALRIMDRIDALGRPVPFDATWVTLDKKRKTGGQVKSLKRVVRAGASHNLQRNRQVAVKRADGKGHNYPIHLRLLLRINGEPVL